jgi:membrane protease YdiL (CAAX protease family)
MKPRFPFRDGLALAFALLFPLVMAWVYFDLMAGDGRRANPAFMLGYAGGKLIQFAFPAVYVYCVARHELRPSRPTTRGLWLGTAFAALVAVAAFAVYFGKLAGDPRLETAGVKIHGKLREFGLDSPAGFLAAALFLSAAHSLFEEYYWRWFVFGWLKRLLPAGAAAVLSSLGFMAHHVVILATYFPGQFWRLALPLSFCVAVGGLVWAWIYHRSGSLYAAWLSHALIDAAIMAVGYLMLRPGWTA